MLAQVCSAGDQPKIVLFKDLAEQARVVRGGTILSENDATVQHFENDPTVPMHLPSPLLRMYCSEGDYRRLATRLRNAHFCGGCPDTFAAPCIVFASWLEYPQRMVCERKWQVGIGR